MFLLNEFYFDLNTPFFFGNKRLFFINTFMFLLNDFYFDTNAPLFLGNERLLFINVFIFLMNEFCESRTRFYF